MGMGIICNLKQNNKYLKSSPKLRSFISLNSDVNMNTISNRVKDRGLVHKIRGNNGYGMKYHRGKKQKKDEQKIIFLLPQFDIKKKLDSSK